MGAAIEDVERGFELHESQQVVQPHKLTLTSQDSVKNGFNILPAIVTLDDREIFGCKLLGANPANLERGLPRAVGLLALFDGDTKVPLAVMDTQVISAMRTGAVSGLAARYLAPHDTESIGLIGAGVNMRTQLLGVNHELPSLADVAVYALNGSKYQFADEMAGRTGLNITPKAHPEAAIAGNNFNILCTTKPTEPLIKEEWLPESGVTLFNISGVATPPETLPHMDRLVTDSLDDCLHRNTQTLPQAVQAGLVDETAVEELGTIIRTSNDRHSEQENIFFCPVGLAFEDVIVGWRVYQSAVSKKLGQTVTLWANTQWV